MVRAAFFDLDKTILDTSSNLALSTPFIDAGLMTRRSAIAALLVQLPYLLSGADEARMDRMASALGEMGKGWNASFLEATVEDALERAIAPTCYVGALRRIAAHKRAGDTVVIASASVEQVVRPIATMLGADAVLASRGDIDESGCFTGVITHYNQGQGKADACAALARKRGWRLDQCYAYSDSISDAPLLRLVGHPCAVNPDRSLRDLAKEEGWPTLTFTESARVRPFPHKPSISLLAGAAFLGGIGVGTALGALAVKPRPRSYSKRPA